MAHNNCNKANVSCKNDIEVAEIEAALLPPRANTEKLI
jgi:hypothetical protein